MPNFNIDAKPIMTDDAKTHENVEDYLLPLDYEPAMSFFFPLKNPIILPIFYLLTLMACQSSSMNKSDLDPELYESEVNEWHQTRIENLKKPDGWLNLVGLADLKEGVNRMGSGEGMDIQVSENFPEILGSLRRENGKVYFDAKVNGIKDENGGDVQDNALVFDGERGELLAYGMLRWTVIKRGDRYLLRLRDLEAKTSTDFKGIDRFPVDMEWRWEVDFVPYEPIKEIQVTNVLGQMVPIPSPGYLSFEKYGKTYKLEVIDEGLPEYFVIFADETSGESTYGGGRYVYVSKPDAFGKTVLDFNKSYNPPCVFTPYATCLLPPREHLLDFPVPAGELNFEY